MPVARLDRGGGVIHIDPLSGFRDAEWGIVIAVDEQHFAGVGQCESRQRRPPPCAATNNDLVVFLETQLLTRADDESIHFASRCRSPCQYCRAVLGEPHAASIGEKYPLPSKGPRASQQGAKFAGV